MGHNGLCMASSRPLRDYYTNLKYLKNEQRTGYKK